MLLKGAFPLHARAGWRTMGSDALIPLTLESSEHTRLSARNPFKGPVKSVKLGEVMAEVVIAVGQIEIVSAITRASAEALHLQPRNEVRAIIKSTEVIIDK
jgi:molybdopterin-binding protein